MRDIEKAAPRANALVLAAHDRLCGAITARSAVAIQAQFCRDEVDIWGLESGDGAHSALEVKAWAARLQAQPHRPIFVWADRTVMVADDVAWLSAKGTLSLAGRAFVERQAFEMFGVLLAVKRQWRWRLLDAGDPAALQHRHATGS